MHKRGIVVLPGGDYGFAWTPHGTYARDLEHFVKLLGFTPHEAIIAATAGVAKLFMRGHELGAIRECRIWWGYVYEVALTPEAIKVYLAIFSYILNLITNYPPFT
jgi:hypothetical protein